MDVPGPNVNAQEGRLTSIVTLELDSAAFAKSTETSKETVSDTDCWSETLLLKGANCTECMRRLVRKSRNDGV